MKPTPTIPLLCAILMSLTTSLQAQTWQGNYMHHGYYCMSLSPDANNNHWALVGKGTDAGGYPTLNLKFRSPYLWQNTGTACVKVVQIDLYSGRRSSGNTYFDYKNGWVYIGHYLTVEGQPSYSYIVTLYKDNDNGTSGGENRTFNLHLDRLDLSRLPFSDKAFETYW